MEKQAEQENNAAKSRSTRVGVITAAASLPLLTAAAFGVAQCAVHPDKVAGAAASWQAAAATDASLAVAVVLATAIIFVASKVAAYAAILRKDGKPVPPRE